MLKFIKGQKLGRIAAELMGVSSSDSYLKQTSNLAATLATQTAFCDHPANLVKLVQYLEFACQSMIQIP